MVVEVRCIDWLSKFWNHVGKKFPICQRSIIGKYFCIEWGVFDNYIHFIFVSIAKPGSSHSSIANQLSSLFSCLNNNNPPLPKGMWITAEAAYVSSNLVLSPWPGQNLPPYKDCFKICLSAACIKIEQTFGVLFGRRRILWIKLRVPIDKAAQIVNVCCELHKFIINHSESTSVRVKVLKDLQGLCMEIDVFSDCVQKQQKSRQNLEDSDQRELLSAKLN